jgi:hypothetical protein
VLVCRPVWHGNYSAVSGSHFCAAGPVLTALLLSVLPPSRGAWCVVGVVLSRPVVAGPAWPLPRLVCILPCLFAMVLAIVSVASFCMAAVMFFLEPVDMGPCILDISSVGHRCVSPTY